MAPQLATVLCIIVIIGLFVLDREREPRTSGALWLPILYVLLNGSRPVSIWLGIAPTGGASIYVEGSPVDRAIDIVLLVAALVVLISKWQRVSTLLRRNGSILLFLSFAGLSVFWSDFPFVTLKHWTKAVCDLAMVLIVVTELHPIAAIRRLLTRTGFVLIPSSLLLCKYYPDLGRKLSVGWVLMYTGVTTDKNTLGEICVIFGLASLWCFLAAWRDRERPGRSQCLLAHAAMVWIVGWLLYMCNSMTSISSIIMIGLVLILLGRPGHPASGARVHLLVAAVVTLSVVALFFDPGGDMIKALGRNPTLTGRTDIWHDVLLIHNNPLIGAGYESFWLGHRLIRIRELAGFAINEAHNGYLEVYLNLGWIGLSLLALVIVTGYYKVVSALRSNPAAGGLSLALLLAAAFHSITEAGFRMQTLSWIFFLWAILAASETVLLKDDDLLSQDDRGDFTALEMIKDGEDGTPALVPVAGRRLMIERHPWKCPS